MRRRAFRARPPLPPQASGLRASGLRGGTRRDIARPRAAAPPRVPLRAVHRYPGRWNDYRPLAFIMLTMQTGVALRGMTAYEALIWQGFRKLLDFYLGSRRASWN
jgi:hypothetical protein